MSRDRYARLFDLAPFGYAVFDGRGHVRDINLTGARMLRGPRSAVAKFPDNDRMLLVAVTGYGHDEARERSFAAGFDQHLAKPVDLPTLRALLESVNP